MGAGIDYGFGIANIDPATGIRYGIIHAGRVEQWIMESQAVYWDMTCASCGETVEDDECECPSCHASMRDDLDCAEPVAFVVDDGEYLAEQGGDDCEIMVLKSPFCTYAKFCSPCYPGAGDLDSPDPDGIMAFCFGSDWFDNGIAPYPVYSVEEYLKEAKR